MKKLIVLTTTILALGLSSSAFAHYGMHSYDAVAYGNWYALQDCGRAWDWVCVKFPNGETSVQGDAQHTWFVVAWYREQNIKPLFSTRTCSTETRWTHGSKAYQHKACYPW